MVLLMDVMEFRMGIMKPGIDTMESGMSTGKSDVQRNGNGDYGVYTRVLYSFPPKQ